jgi:hypothetical protein
MGPVKGLLKKSERKSRLHTIDGNREIETHGLNTGFWRDLYHIFAASGAGDYAGPLALMVGVVLSAAGFSASAGSLISCPCR